MLLTHHPGDIALLCRHDFDPDITGNHTSVAIVEGRFAKPPIRGLQFRVVLHTAAEKMQTVISTRLNQGDNVLIVLKDAVDKGVNHVLDAAE